MDLQSTSCWIRRYCISWRLPLWADHELRVKQWGHMGRGGALFSRRKGNNFLQLQHLPSKVWRLFVWSSILKYYKTSVEPKTCCFPQGLGCVSGLTLPISSIDLNVVVFYYYYYFGRRTWRGQCSQRHRPHGFTSALLPGYLIHTYSGQQLRYLICYFCYLVTVLYHADGLKCFFILVSRWASSNQWTERWTIPLPGLHWCLWQQDPWSSNAMLPTHTGTQDDMFYNEQQFKIHKYNHVACVSQHAHIQKGHPT